MRSSPEVAYGRLLKRKRPEEKAVPLEYLTQLHQLHETWLYNRHCQVATAKGLATHTFQSFTDRKVKVIVMDGNLPQPIIEDEYKRCLLDIWSSIALLPRKTKKKLAALDEPTPIVKFQKLSDAAKLPLRATANSIGYDLFR